MVLCTLWGALAFIVALIFSFVGQWLLLRLVMDLVPSLDSLGRFLAENIAIACMLALLAYLAVRFPAKSNVRQTVVLSSISGAAVGCVAYVAALYWALSGLSFGPG